MSTKIYNGYKIEGDIFNVMDKLHILKSTMITKVYHDIKSTIVEGHNVAPNNYEAFNSVLNNIEEGSVSTTRNGNCIDASVCILPFDNNIYATTYFNMNWQTEMFESMDGVSEFMYWDNTDPPEDISETDWEQRDILWGKILRDWKAPGFVGMTFDFLIPDYIKYHEYLKTLQVFK